MGKSLVIIGSDFSNVRTDVVTLLPSEARGDISNKVIVYVDDAYISPSAEIGDAVSDWERSVSAGIHRLLKVRVRAGYKYTGSVYYDRGSGFMTSIVVDENYNVLQVGPVKSTGGAATINFDFTTPNGATYIIFTTFWNVAEANVQVVESEIVV